MKQPRKLAPPRLSADRGCCPGRRGCHPVTNDLPRENLSTRSRPVKENLARGPPSVCHAWQEKSPRAVFLEKTAPESLSPTRARVSSSALDAADPIRRWRAREPTLCPEVHP